MPLSAYQTRVLADGALAYWPLDDAIGSATARDLAGSRTAVISGGVLLAQPGVWSGGGRAMVLDGTGKLVPSTFPALGSAFTLEAWVKPTSTDSIYQRPIMSRQILSDGDFQWTRQGPPPNQLRFYYYSGAYFTANFATGIPLGAWTHVVVTGASGAVILYCNGVAGSPTAMTLSGAGVGAPALGSFVEATGAEQWMGALQDLAVYPRALTATEITAHYTLQLEPPPPVVSSAIDRALLALLAGDSTLMALTPDGVFWDEAPPHATRFVLVSLLHEADEPMFGSRAYEAAHYLVKAVMLSTAGGDIAAAADRIDVLLEGAQILATGYTPMLTARDERIRFTEVDALDDTVRWLHRGGQYLVWMSL